MRRRTPLIRLLAIAGIAVLACSFAGSAFAAKKRKPARKKPPTAIAQKPGARPVQSVPTATATPTPGGFVPVLSSSASSASGGGSAAPSIVSNDGASAAAPNPSVTVTITRDGNTAYCRANVSVSGLAQTTPPLNGMTLGLMSPRGNLQSVGRLSATGSLSSNSRLTSGGGIGTWGSAVGTSRLYIYARSSTLGGYAYIPFEGNVFANGNAVSVNLSNSCA